MKIFGFDWMAVDDTMWPFTIRHCIIIEQSETLFSVCVFFLFFWFIHSYTIFYVYGLTSHQYIERIDDRFFVFLSIFVSLDICQWRKSTLLSKGGCTLYIVHMHILCTRTHNCVTWFNFIICMLCHWNDITHSKNATIIQYTHYMILYIHCALCIFIVDIVIVVIFKWDREKA